MLLVNLKVILEKHGKPLTNLLPVAPTIQKKVNINRFQKTKEKIYSSTQYPVKQPLYYQYVN